MDGDTSDTTTGVGDSLNGETKPDPAKLAQTAIIKQDVMLSGTSTQSPVSSVLTMPTVSMPAAISMATGSASSLPGAASLHGTLPDNLFLSAVPSVPSMTNDTATAHTTSNADKNDVSGASSNTTTHTLSNQTQLLGQPQVAPQFIVAGQALQSQGAGAAAMPMQQLLIPVSTGNGTQQLLSIPVSLAGGGNHQIQLLTTSNGQIIATNLSNLAGCAGLTQPINVTIPTNAGAPSQSIASSSTAASVTQGVTQSISSTMPVSNSALVAAHQPAPTVTPTAAMPQLITNAQGQIVAIGAPQVLPQSVSMTHNGTATGTSTVNTAQLPQTLVTTAPSQPQVITATQQLATQAALQISQSTQVGPTTQLVQSMAGTTMVAQPTLAQQVVTAVTQPSTTNSLPPNVNQLLPNTVSNSTESTTVDGINLDEIKEFAKQFKIRRLSLGLTQTQVGQALSATEGPAYSQSAICRFEKLDITPKSAQKIKPVLERWMMEAEERYKNGMQNLTDFIGSEPSKKRKRRTSFTPQALEILNEHFERNTHPSGAEMTELSGKLNYNREVIRVWFCNKRQALKNTIKKLQA